MAGPLREIIEKLEPELGAPEGDPAPLEGGITNRNFRTSLGGTDYVVRLPGKDTELLGIDREAERDANQHAAGLGVAPPVAAMLTDPPCLVTEFVEGEEMSAEDLRAPANRERVMNALRSIHDSGGTVSTSFDSFRVVEDYEATASARGVEIPPAYAEAKEHAAEIEKALTGPEHEPVLCHNDLLAANFLDDGDRIWIVDWEYAGMGDRYFDLANFAINNEVDPAQHGDLLADYLGAHAAPEQLAALRLMMFMSDFREAMWGVVQSGVSDLDFDFDDYAAKHFSRMRDTAAGPGFEALLGEVRAAS